jgi:hypothetical protein
LQKNKKCFTDIFGQIGDQSLESLEFGNAFSVLSNQPFGA